MAKLGPLIIEEFLRYLAPSIWGRTDVPRCPIWPGDLFAIAAALLEKSAAYSFLGTRIWPRGVAIDAWHDELAKTGLAWRIGWIDKLLPPGVRVRWRMLTENLDLPVAEIANSSELCLALFELVAICDESLCGIGLESFEFDETSRLSKKIKAARAFWWHADELLAPSGLNGESKCSTLCDQIHPSRLCVLPKSQTPQSGLSLRSLTHHLALCPPVNIMARWHSTWPAPDAANKKSCNLLIVPWPFEVTPSQFSPLPFNGTGQEFLPQPVGWFAYRPKDASIGCVIEEIEALLQKAQSDVGQVHVVVLPEVALTLPQYMHLRELLIEKEITLVAGVVDEAQTGWCRNYVRVAFPTRGAYFTAAQCLDFEQQKHHRWRLDRDQIVRYGLSTNLDPQQCWWEGIEVHDRTINFFRLRSWLSTCVLVCEDLARVDPVGRFVRAVGPDLVIALLMDGPQLRQRWSAYHATVLADDPGSSVLTLTSLGMTRLSRPMDMLGLPDTPVIALWRDPVTGVAEIRLPVGAKAAVLTLNRSSTNETTADGRSHPLDLGAPIYGGISFL